MDRNFSLDKQRGVRGKLSSQETAAFSLMWRQEEAEMSKADSFRVVTAQACVRGEISLLFTILMFSRSVLKPLPKMVVAM